MRKIYLISHLQICFKFHISQFINWATSSGEKVCRTVTSRPAPTNWTKMSYKAAAKIAADAAGVGASAGKKAFMGGSPGSIL